MKDVFTTIFLLTSFITFAQTTDKFEPFNVTDYPSDKYQIKLDTVTFSKFKIEIRQVKLLNGKTQTPLDFYCRGWLTISEGNKILTQRFFKSIEPVGGCSGLFIPDSQPRKDFFVISKFGDYDGIIFIIDTTGHLTEKGGGTFYVSKDKRYLFSNYSSDAAGLTVYDLSKRQLLYSILEDTVPNYLGDWYFQNAKYFARAYDNNEDDEGQQIKIATFDFKANKIVISKVDKSFLQSDSQLKTYNSQYDKDCNCGN